MPVRRGVLIGTELAVGRRPGEQAEGTGGAKMIKVKVCGMLREEDIISSRKADYVGFIVETSSRRELTISRAEQLMSMAKCRKVIVTTCQSEEVLKQIVRVLKPDVLQLHSVMDVEDVEAIANAIPCDVWALQPMGWGDELERSEKLVGKCSGLVLDTASPTFGGTASSMIGASAPR